MGSRYDGWGGMKWIVLVFFIFDSVYGYTFFLSSPSSSKVLVFAPLFFALIPQKLVCCGGGMGVWMDDMKGWMDGWMFRW